jgi:hypothetical protein
MNEVGELGTIDILFHLFLIKIGFEDGSDIRNRGRKEREDEWEMIEWIDPSGMMIWYLLRWFYNLFWGKIIPDHFI